MKIKQLLLAALAVLIIFSAPPSYALSAEQAAEINCYVEPVYEFSVPRRATIWYPQAEAQVGTFKVVNLLSEYLESISIEVTPGALESNNGSEPALPYTVSVDAPIELDSSNTGDEYIITVSVDPDAFEQVEAKKYDASVIFRAVSYPSSAVVWEGEMRLTVHKTGTANRITRTAEDIPEEEVPAAFAQSIDLTFWAFIFAAVCVFLLVIFIILLSKRKRKEKG